jgi:hypothetical protein
MWKIDCDHDVVEKFLIYVNTKSGAAARGSENLCETYFCHTMNSARLDPRKKHTLLDIQLRVQQSAESKRFMSL